MSQRNLAWLIVVPAAVLFTGVLSYTAPPPEQDYKRVRTVVDVLAEVDKNFYRELTEDEKQKLVEDMINGGLRKLDDYSEYFNEEKLKQFNADNKGTFGGIGAYLGLDPDVGVLTIESTMPESPAEEKGLRPGDLILKIDGQPTERIGRREEVQRGVALTCGGLGLAEEQKVFRADDFLTARERVVEASRKRIKGAPNSEVALGVRRGGDVFDVTVPRRDVQLHPVKGVRRDTTVATRWDYLADPEYKIALVRLSDFTESSGEEMDAALKACETAGAKAVILDLRNNPGGLLRMAEHVSDLFLADGDIVHTRDRHNDGRDLKAKKDGTVWEDAGRMPMAVLTNGGSASAAEIVAAALQDNGRAGVVGERTYGKGCVQRPFEMGDGKTALKLTTEIWLTPNGRHIQKRPNAKPEDEWGVRPDDGLEVKMTDEQLYQYILHLRQADLLPRQAGEEKDPQLRRLDPSFKDPVVEKALDYLRGKIKEVGVKRGLGGPA